MTAPASLASTSAYTACSFKPARSNCRAHRQNKVKITSQAAQEDGRRRALVAGLALVASVPLVFNGSANAFVGNTAKDFAEKAEQVTPDVPLPGLKQKGKEAEAIGKAPAQSGPGASDQVKGAASDVADKAGDIGKGALGEAQKPSGGLFGRINKEALTENAPSVQFGK